MMKRHTIAGLLATTSLIPFAAFAQDAVFDLEPIIVEANSLTPVEQTRSGANVEVLSGSDAGANDTRVVDRLVRLPGVNLTSNGGLGSSTGIQIRGLPSRYVGVRIDGIDVSDPSGTQTQFDFGGLTSASVKRVEVLKGSQSALFGSEAIAGVVSMQSFRPEAMGTSGAAQFEAGSRSTYSGALSFGHRTEDGYVALSVGHVQTDGISAQTFNDERDGFDQTSVNLSAEFAVSDQITLGGALLYRESDIEIDRSSFSNDSSGEIASEERGARVFARYEAGILTHELSVSTFDILRQDPGGFTTEFNGARQSIAYLGSADLSTTTRLTFGLDQTREEIDAGGVEDDEVNTSVTAELLYSPTDQVDLSAALRYDDNSSFGGQLTGRLTAVYRPRADLAFRGSVGTGYRAPSLYERYSAFGDPDLSPENSLSYELGVEKTYGAAGYVKATLFYTEIDDLIDFDGASNVCGSGFGCYNQVPGETVSKGFEISGEYALSDRISLYGAYTFTNAETEGERRVRTPKHDLVLGVSGEFADRWSGYLDVRRVADVKPSAFAPADHKVGDYTLVGMGVSYDMTDTSELYLRVENLLDEDYETAGGFNQPGRSIFVGLRADF